MSNNKQPQRAAPVSTGGNAITTFDVQPQEADSKLITQLSAESIEIVDAGAAAPTDAIAHEAFMNEFLTVQVAETTQEGELDVITLNVNGRNMPVQRGVPTKVRRKFVEVLARAKTISYKQVTPNPMERDQIVLQPKTAYAYPFAVLHDPNPNGRDWLKNIMAEPA